MKSVKVIMIAAEVAAIFGVLFLSFSHAERNIGHFFNAAYISLFCLLAVVLQCEQQKIEWQEKDD